MAVLRRKDIKKIKINQLIKKIKHNFYSGVVNNFMSLSSPMMCVSHFRPFSPISQVKQWPQAKRAAAYRAKCQTRLLSVPTELEYRSYSDARPVAVIVYHSDVM
jgi:hypothetical protein